MAQLYFPKDPLYTITVIVETNGKDYCEHSYTVFPMVWKKAHQSEVKREAAAMAGRWQKAVVARKEAERIFEKSHRRSLTETESERLCYLKRDYFELTGDRLLPEYNCPQIKPFYFKKNETRSLLRAAAD